MKFSKKSRPPVTFAFFSRLPIEMSTKDFNGRVLATQQKLYRFALRMLGSVQEAEDVVQEVLVIMWKRRSELPSISNIEAWCMRVTKNLSLDKLKAGCNQPHEEVDKLEFEQNNPTPLVQAENTDMMAIIHKAIQALPEKQKMVIQLRDVEGLSYQEIGDALEMPMNQVKVNLFRARKTLRERIVKLESYGIS